MSVRLIDIWQLLSFQVWNHGETLTLVSEGDFPSRRKSMNAMTMGNGSSSSDSDDNAHADYRDSDVPNEASKFPPRSP